MLNALNFRIQDILSRLVRVDHIYSSTSVEEIAYRIIQHFALKFEFGSEWLKSGIANTCMHTVQ